jgi:ribose 5-phosphate isomerase A
MPMPATELNAIVERALALVPNGSVVGLGSGRAASAFIRALGERVGQGLRVRGVPTSRASAELAREVGIPLVDLSEVETIDVDVDGADEVDPQCNLIKGLGGALLREKIVAAASRQLVILVGAEKVVPVLGTRGILPVEIVPFGLEFCERRLTALGLKPIFRLRDGKPFVTDNGNHILDCRIGPIEDPAEFERAIHAIPGVVGTGLFLGMAHTVLIQTGATVEVRERA